MHGYHFTTVEAFRRIKQVGIKPGPMIPQPGLAAIEEYIRNGGIWLYHKRLTGHKLLGMLIYLAINHGSDRIVRLRVDYDEWQAVSFHARRDSACLASNFVHDYSGAGHYGHLREPFEVLIEPVVPERIRLLDYWNLMDVVDHSRLRKPESVAC